jgi:predicted RNA-binding protein with PIN domain
MSIHIIIDGYNLIRQSDELSRLDSQDLQLGRQALIDRLAAYKRMRRHEITVVFDAGEGLHQGRQKAFVKGIKITYSGRGELADTVIKQMAVREKQRATVVSSDNDVASHCRACGCATLSSEEFEQRLMMAAFGEAAGEGDVTSGWVPTTRKKGPARRLPRRERRRQRKIGKL